MKKDTKHIMKIRILILFPILLFTLTGKVCADGLSALAEVGKSQDAMVKVLNEETKSFEAVKKAIEKGGIEKGESQDVIAKRYGEPVIALPDDHYAEKWIYKPGYASWFDGIKIYLFFNKDKQLEGIKQSR